MKLKCIYKINNFSNTNTIIINIGCDVYIETSYKEALEIINKKHTIMNNRILLLTDQILKNKTYIKLTLNLLEQIKDNN